VTDTTARLQAIASAAVLAIALAVLYVTSHPGLGGTSVKAEFEDAYPLLEGMHVRVSGAIAGSANVVELTDEGTAMVTMQLHEGTEPPRADATASIRQEDITGDSYVALSPGDEPEELGDNVIPTEHTLVAPRFDDLLNSFDEPVRQGLEMLFVQLGVAVDRRGEDLNEAALQLRPALRATNQALSEVESQNDALKALIVDAERVTGQAAGRSRELGNLVDSLAETLRTTAAHSPALDRALEIAPETVPRTRRTLERLTRFAVSARPLAVTLGEAAPELAESARLLGPFLDDAEAILDDVEPTLDLTVRLLRASLPTVEANPKRIFTAPFDLSAGIGGLLDALIGDEHLLKALFGADTYGGMEPGDFSDDVGLGSVGVELGTQQGYPADYDPQRRFLRAVAVPSCEMFGLPIQPNCLLDFLASLSTRERNHGGPDGRRARARRAQPVPGPPRPELRLPVDPRGSVDGLRRGLDRALGEIGGRLNLPRRDRDRGTSLGGLEGLLDFVLGP
jgi:virulence factor Mce-like protein